MATVTLSGVDQIIVATQKAILVRFNNNQETWIPRSVCTDGSELEIGDTDIVVQEWFAEKEGLD